MNKISVLQNFKKVESDPYPYIMIQQALPEHIHNELLSTLPNEFIDQQESRDHHGKKTYHVNQVKKDGWKISNIWKEFTEYHTSREFFDRVMDIFSPWNDILPIKKDKIILEDRSQTQQPADVNCFTDFNFVKHPPENNVSNRTPHCDNEKEIYAGLLYLKHKDDHSTGGGFNIHKADNLQMTGLRELVTPGPVVNTCPYESNNFAMFLNVKRSVHSVEPRQNAHHPRISINMIARYHGARLWK